MLLRTAHRRRLLAPLLTAGALALVAASSAAASSKLKLPAERTSPTGNFFTLEAYGPPSSSRPDAEFQMKVCTSSHTPAGTAIEPSLFTLKLTDGAVVPESISAARSPAMVATPLAKLQCTEGWLGFAVPKSRSASTLEYEYNGQISWNVG